MEVPPRAALFLDLASLEVMSSHHAAHIRPRQLLERLTQDRWIVRAAAYGARDDDHPESEQRLARLAAEGFKVIAKPLRRRADGVMRASLSVDIAVDALELAPRLDAWSLLTTDADFASLIEAVQRRGVRVEVVTSRELAPPALVQAADRIVEFASLIDPASSNDRRPRTIPTERGNARARLDPPPRRRSRRGTSGRRDAEPAKATRGAEATEARGDAKPAPDRPAPDPPDPPAPPAPAASKPAGDGPPSQGSRSTGAEPRQASVKVLPQENLTGRAVQPSPDEA